MQGATTPPAVVSSKPLHPRPDFSYGRLLILKVSLGPPPGHPKGTTAEALHVWSKTWRGPQHSFGVWALTAPCFTSPQGRQA